MAVKKLGFYISIGILYFFLVLPFAENTSLGAYSQIRLTSLLPMAAGMLCGFPGALACAMGNLAGDLYSGLNIYCIFGFLGNFLMAWLPYKLWHTLFFGRPCSLQYLESPASIFKFVGISVITSCASVGVIGAGGHLLGGFSFGSFFLPVALQYYDFSLLGGILIFQVCLTVFRICPHIPENLYACAYQTKYYIIDYILAAVIVMSSCILTVLTFRKERTGDPAILLLCLVVLLCSLVLGGLPCGQGKKTGRKNGHLCPFRGAAGSVCHNVPADFIYGPVGHGSGQYPDSLCGLFGHGRGHGAYVFSVAPGYCSCGSGGDGFYHCIAAPSETDPAYCDPAGEDGGRIYQAVCGGRGTE